MGESKKELLAQGHTTRDMLNTHLDMLGASMLARVHEHTYTHMHSGWLLWGQGCAVIFYSGHRYTYVYFQLGITLFR